MGLVEIAGLARARPGLRVCGDAWTRLDREDGALVAVVDGLGHGPEAAEAARAAVETLNVQATAAGPCNLSQLLAAMHETLRGTRGAVAGVALVEACTGSLHYAGIGNTEVRLFGPAPSRLFSRPGLLGGGRAPRPTVQSARLPPGAVLMLHTDGVGPLEGAQVPLRLSCQALAQHVLERWAHAEDDAAVVVVRRGARE